MSDHPPPEWREMLQWAPWLLVVAGVARALHHHRLVEMGRRRLWSWSLIWEVPTAALCAVVGAGAAQWLGWHVGEPGTAALVGIVSLLGPRGIESAVTRVLDHYYPEGRE
jgi:hypothetical protein